MILAFDCATATGWCAGDGSTTPVLGNVTMPKADFHGQVFDFWRRWLVRHIEEIKPTVVVYESPFLPANMNGTTVEKLMGITAVLQEVCANLRIPCEMTTNTHVKKVLTGSGKGEKPDMMRVAKQCGVTPKTYDEADAFGVWIAAIHYHAKQYQPAWDKKLYSGKGLL